MCMYCRIELKSCNDVYMYLYFADEVANIATKLSDIAEF